MTDAAKDAQLNEQAMGVATTVLSEPVLAATRCMKQSSGELAERAMGFSSITQWMTRLAEKVSPVRSANTRLPHRFLLAVTADKLHALEDRQSGGSLVAGEEITSWARGDVIAKSKPLSLAMGANVLGDDQQVMVVFLPFQRKGRAMGKFPLEVLIGKDPASQGVLEAMAGAQQIAAAEAAQKMIADRGL